MKNKITIFNNKYAGKEIKKDGKTITNSNGEPITQSDLNAIIEIHEPLQTGTYVASIYKRVSKNGELSYYAGTIKKDIKSNNQSNQNTQNNSLQDDDEIPF